MPGRNRRFCSSVPNISSGCDDRLCTLTATATVGGTYAGTGAAAGTTTQSLYTTGLGILPRTVALSLRYSF